MMRGATFSCFSERNLPSFLFFFIFILVCVFFINQVGVELLVNIECVFAHMFLVEPIPIVLATSYVVLNIRDESTC
jgi:hypothetical protein